MRMNTNRFIKKLTSVALTMAMLVTSVMTITPAAYAAGDEDIVYLQHDFEDGSIAPFKNLSVQRGRKLYINSKYNDCNTMNSKGSRVMYLESVVYGMKVEDTVAGDPADIKQDSNGWTHGFYSSQYGNLMYTDLDTPVEDAKALLKFRYYAYTPSASSAPTFGVYFSKDAAPTDVTTFDTAADIEETENQALAFRLGYSDFEAYINKEIKNNYVEKDLNKTVKFEKESWVDVEFLIDMQQGSATLYLDGKKVGTSKVNLEDLPRIKQIQLRMDPTDWGDHRCFIDDISLTSLPKSFSLEATPNSTTEVELSSQYSIADTESLTQSDFNVKSVADETEIPVSEVRVDGKKIILSLSQSVKTDTPYKVVAGDGVKDIFGNNASGPASFFVAGTDLSYKAVFSDDFESGRDLENKKVYPSGWQEITQFSGPGVGEYIESDGNYKYKMSTSAATYSFANSYRISNLFAKPITSGKHKLSFDISVPDGMNTASNEMWFEFSAFKAHSGETNITLWEFLRVNGNGDIMLSNSVRPAADDVGVWLDDKVTAEKMLTGVKLETEFDFDNKKETFYVDGKKIHEGEIKDNFTSMPGFQFLIGGATSETNVTPQAFIIDNVKFETAMAKASVKDVKFIDIAGNEIIADSNIVPAGITGVKIEFSGGASPKTGDISIIGGNETIVSENFDAETAVYTAEFSAPLATETEYTLKVESCVDDTYSQSFITDSGRYEILTLNVKDGNLNYKAINTTEGNQPIFITYGVYGKDSDGVKTVKTIDSGLIDSFRGMIEGTLPVTAEASSLIKAFAWDSTASQANMNSICKEYSSAEDEIIISDADAAKSGSAPIVYQTGDCLKLDGYGIDSCVQVKISDGDNNIVYLDQADGKGDYSFSVNLGSSDAYNVDIKEDNNTEYSIPYVYLNHDTMASAYTDLFSTANGDNLADFDTFKAYCDTNKYALGFYNDLDTADVNNAVFTKLYSEVKASKPIDSVALKAMYEKCVLMANSGNSKFENIYDYIGDYYLSAEDVIKSTALQSVFGADYVTEKVQKSVTAKLKAMKPATIADFDKDIVKAYALGIVKSVNGWKSVEKALNAVASELALTTVVQKGAEAVIGKDYSNISDLNTAIVNAQAPDSNNPGGSGGGGGGVSIGGSGKYTSVKEVESSGNTVLPLSGETSGEVFNDLQSVDWAKNAILSLAEKGIINGKGSGSFAPNDSILREEFTKIIVGAFVDEEEADISFADVDNAAWYAPYIKRAYASGIINGVSEDSFGTGISISREDMAVIIYRAAKLVGVDLSDAETSAFGDDGEISDYAKEAVYALKASGLVNGVSDNSFAPKQNLTRAETAVIINRLLPQ